jgi:hypothetical protein
MGIAQIASTIKDPGSVSDLLFGTPVLIGELQVDVLRLETATYDYDITERPVETGLDITDARIAKPVTLVMEGILADTDFSISSVAANVAGAIQGGGFNLDTWQDKKDALLTLAESNEVIDITTPLNIYFNFMILSVRIDQDKDTSQACFFRAEFKEVRQVSLLSTFVDESQIPKKLQKKKTATNTKAQGKASKKGQQGKKATKAAPEKDSSIAFGWAEALRGG